MMLGPAVSGSGEQRLVEGGRMAALGGTDIPRSSGGSDDQRLIISQRMKATGPGAQSGTWVAAGAVNDNGTADATSVVVEHGDGKALVKATHILSSVDGTITLESHTWFRPFPPPTPPHVMVEGEWKQVAATGVYADMDCRGRLYATVDLTTREITIVRDGSAE
jgi:hypothetical protein